MKSSALVLIQVILFFCSGFGSAFGEGIWNSYTDTNSIMDIAINGDRVWCATWGGIVCRDRTDGTFKIYTTGNGLPSNQVDAVAVGPDGVAWFGTDKGIISFDGRSWKTYPVDQGFPSSQNNMSIAVAGNGTAWFSKYNAVIRYDGKTLMQFTTANGLPDKYIHALVVDRSNNLWVGTGKGLSRFDGSTWKTYTILDGLPDNIVYDIALGNNGVIWIGTGKGISSFDGELWTSPTQPAELRGKAITSIAVDGIGIVWAGNSDGLFRFDENTWTVFKKTDTGRVWGSVDCLAVDSDNALWVDNGSRGYPGGITRYDGSTWRNFMTPGLLGGVYNYVTSSLVDRGNVKWFGNNFSLAQFDDTSWKIYTDVGGVNAIAVDASNAKWIGTGSGIYRFDGSSLERFSTNDGLPSDIITALAFDRNGALWIGTINGLAKYFGGEWKVFAVQDDLPINGIKNIVTDLNDCIWIVTESGVSRFDGLQWTFYSNERYFAPYCALSIAVDKNNVKWFGTHRTILSFDDSEWKVFTNENTGVPVGIPVLSIAVDKNNAKWFGTGSGVLRFDGTEWTQFVNNDDPSTKTPNMETVPLVNNYVTTVVVDENNVKWFGTYSGITSYDENSSSIQTRVSSHHDTINHLIMMGVYPNPFNASTDISFHLGKESAVEINIYSITGQRIASPLTSRLGMGFHTIRFDASHFSSGTYLYRIITPEACVTGKMVLMK